MIAEDESVVGGNCHGEIEGVTTLGTPMDRRLSKLQERKALLLQLNLRYNNNVFEADALREKLKKEEVFSGVPLGNFRGKVGGESLRDFLPLCPSEAARRRLSRLILLEGRLMPDLCRQIYKLDIEVS